MPATPGVAWVLFPTSNGTVNFLKDTPGPGADDRGRQRPRGADRAPDPRRSWVANSLNDTVQRLDVAAQIGGTRRSPSRALRASLQMTPDGRTLLVLSFGDGRHAGDAHRDRHVDLR